MYTFQWKLIFLIRRMNFETPIQNIQQMDLRSTPTSHIVIRDVRVKILTLSGAQNNGLKIVIK